MQAVVVKLHKLRRQNVTFRSYPRRLIDENRWRAGRYGLDGKLIDFGRKCEMDERELLHEMLEFIATEVDALGSQSEIAHIERIMAKGTGADRQLAVWERTHDMKARWSITLSPKHTKGWARREPVPRSALTVFSS